MLTRNRGDRGYVAVLTSLLIVPLLGFVGLAVDVGYWYVENSNLQSASDAAALAGVIWQPDFAKAETEALAVAASNGYTTGIDNIVVEITNVAPNRISVTITDTNAQLFFAQLFLNNVTRTRTSEASYSPTVVEIGNPTNHYGTGDVMTVNPDNFNASITGTCNPREVGDAFSSMFQASWDQSLLPGDKLCPTWGGGPGPNTGISGNTNADPNPYRTGGYPYTYRVNVPAGSADVDLWLRDPGFAPAGGTDPPSSDTVTTIFRIRAPDGTPLNDSDNPTFTGCSTGTAAPAGTVTYPSGASGGTATPIPTDIPVWDMYCRIPAGHPGTYLLDVATTYAEPGSFGVNYYGLAAISGTLGTECDSRVTSLCPTIRASTWAAVNNALQSTATQTFYLAKIGDIYSGTTLKVSLFDIGENASTIEILDPTGTPVSFAWATRDGTETGNGTTLDVSGTIAARIGIADNSHFNDRWVDVTIQLPADITATYGTNYWWKIRYVRPTSTGTYNDQVTWGVSTTADQIRLTK